MNDQNSLEKKYLENTLCAFIFGIIGCIVPIFLFSVVAYTYSKKHKYEKLAKLHKVGEILSYVGLCISSALIIGLTVYGWLTK